MTLKMENEHTVSPREKQQINKVFARTVNKNLIHEAVILVENTSGEYSYNQGFAGKDIDTPFLIASITKLLTTACIFMLYEQGKLSLDDKITTYVDVDMLRSLHVYKGEDHTEKLTISHLLQQTSGLSDIYEEGKINIRKRVIAEDMAIGFDEKLMMTRKMKPQFAPDKAKRAHYSDINFDLLGEIMEIITDLPLEDVYKQYIFDPLGLKSTYLPVEETDFIPDVYYKDTPLSRPKFIRSCRASGGCISTARELMVFIKAFIGGKLFNKNVNRKSDANNRLQVSMMPIHYGTGYMRVPLGGLGTLFMGSGELIGHSGSSGSFAFYHPPTDLFFVGDVNQMANPALPVRLAMQLALAMK